jgi:hypothetical protein
MKVTVTQTTTIDVPKGTKVIRNNNWITLARKNKEKLIEVITVAAEEAEKIDFHDEKRWTVFEPNEIHALYTFSRSR